jgi:AraC family transcriptional regulator, transcriptional activator of pobA
MQLTRTTRRDIPSFSLYGEQSNARAPLDPLHIEDIQSRSKKYLWQIGTHRHTHSSQCLFVAAGPVNAQLEDSQAELEGPAVVIIPAGTVHAFGFRADTHGYVLTMDLDRLLSITSPAHRSLIAALFACPRVVALHSDPELAARVAQLLATLWREFRQPDSPAAPVSGWLACSVLWTLAARVVSDTEPGSASRQEADRLGRFRALLEAHYLEHWPVARYAKRLALSESGLNRLCRHLAGRSAFDLVQQRLSLEARRRLVYVDGPVASIAAQLGFKDPAYFCRFFRKHNAMTPGMFRRLADR